MKNRIDTVQTPISTSSAQKQELQKFIEELGGYTSNFIDRIAVYKRLLEIRDGK